MAASEHQALGRQVSNLQQLDQCADVSELKQLRRCGFCFDHQPLN